MTAKSMNTLKSRKVRISYKEDTISTTLEIKLSIISSNATYVKEIRFKETRNTTK